MLIKLYNINLMHVATEHKLADVSGVDSVIVVVVGVYFTVLYIKMLELNTLYRVTQHDMHRRTVGNPNWVSFMKSPATR